VSARLPAQAQAVERCPEERHDLARPPVDQRLSDRHRVPALTGIRGYAACWVVLFHAVFVAGRLQPALPQQSALPIVNRGYLAVDLFFILSGYVLMLSHGEALRQRRAWALRAFFAGRIGRILPLHWTVLALLWGLTAIKPRWPWIGIEPDGSRLFFQNLVLVQGWLGNPLSWNTPAWSLSAEWLAYAAFPVLVLLVARVNKQGCWAVIGGGFVLLALAASRGQDGGLNHVHALGLVRCLCEFPMGMAGFRLRQHGRPGDPATADRWFRAGVGLFALALTTPRLDAVATLAFLAMVMASGGGSALAGRLFGHPVAVHLGEISFSLYLLHFAWFGLAWGGMASLVPPTPAWVAATVGASCLLLVPLAHLAWRGIEGPGQALGRRLQRRRPTDVTPPGTLPRPGPDACRTPRR